MSDLASLPNLNFVTFTAMYSSFFSQATREKVQKYVNDHFSQERVKLLTREEIITYGKGKQFILEPGQAQTLPADDPRAKMSDADQIAKSAYEKLFEMQVISRRLKKERLQKIEDEAKAAGQPLQIDTDLLDAIFHIVDFPQSKEEALAFAKHQTTINLVFEISQNYRQPTPDDEDEVIEALQGQEQPLENEAEGHDAHNDEKTKHRIEQLLAAREASQKTNVLRHLAHMKLEFIHWPVTDYKLNEHGEEIEVKKESEVAFSDDLNGKLEHYGALYVKYQRFREKVSLMPLAPDHQVLDALNNLQGQSEDYKQWLSNVENLIASLDQQIHSDPASSETIVVQKKEVEDERASKAADEDERRRIIHECRDKLKDSVDDKYYIQNYELDQYKQAFLPHKEGQNTIGSIMSAMVSQIASENSYHDVYDSHLQKQQQSELEKSNSTADETIDDLFESFNAEVNYDLQIWNRPSFQHENDQEVSIPLQPQTKERKAGANPYLQQQLDSGEVVEYNYEMDQGKTTIQKMQKVATAQSEDQAEHACARAKKIIDNLVLPGISSRHLMPPISLKSQRLRDLERPNVYPFSTLPVEEVERGLIMKSFQELIRFNHIDEGAHNDKERHSKYKVFERSYEEHMTQEILRQVLAEALIHEPDVATLYYPRDDSLLVALYNKVKSDKHNKMGTDGERQWRAAYRVMPDFENWIKYFSEDMVVEAQGSHKVEGHPVKYQLDDELIPDSLIDIDDQKVSNIQENSQMFYPYDGSVMKTDACSVGGVDFKKSIITKDNLTFGLRRANDKEYEGDSRHKEEENGLVSYTKVGDTDLWVRFENDTKVLIESVQKKRNPQKLIRIDPPKPTAEELAAREEALKQAQAAAAKNKGKPGQPPAPVIEEYKEPEPTFEPEPFDFLDTLFHDDELEQAYYNQVTTTLGNGLIVQHMSDGNIIQMTQDQLLNGEGEERDRVFFFASNGVVVRHFRNRDAEVLFPTGVRAHFSKKDMTWIVTNNKGMRRAKKAGIEWDLEPIPCAYETDSVTQARMMIRDDKVMTLEFSDGSLFCQHSDGTLMKTSADGCEIRIEKEGYAPVVFRRGVESEDGRVLYPGRQQARESKIIGQRITPEQRSIDRVIVEAHLPDGTIVDTYLDCGLIADEVGIQHIFNRPDFSILAINQLDKIKLISSNARSALNEGNSKRTFGQDYDYLLALTQDDNDLSRGVYTGVVSHQPRHTRIYINDDEKNLSYMLTSDLQLVKQPLSQNSEDDIQLDIPITSNSNNNGVDTFENINMTKNPYSKHFTLPRLFVIRNDGTGYELLTKEQLDYYFRVQKHSKESMKQRKDTMIGSTQAKAHYFLTKVRTLADRELEGTQLKSLEFPQNSLYALLHLKQVAASKQTEQQQIQPEQFLFRQIFEFQPFEMLKQQMFHDDLERFKKWRLSQVRYDTEFGIVHAPAKDGSLDIRRIEEDEQVARKIILRILKERRNKREKFDADILQEEFLMGIHDNQQVSEYQRRMTTGLLTSAEHNFDGILSSPKGGDASTKTGKRVISLGQTAGSGAFKLAPETQELLNKKLRVSDHVHKQLQEIRRMVNTPEFVPSYYQTRTGHQFAKANPPKAPSQEVLMRMSQRIDRSNQQTTDNNKNGSQYQDANSSRSHPMGRDANNASPLGEGRQQTTQQDEMMDRDKESPIVALEPEEMGLKQGSAFLGGSKKMVTNPDGTITMQGAAPSLYLQEKVYIKQKKEEQLLKAEEYHVIKTKEFNVVGRLRQDKLIVKVMQKSHAASELNEKFITTECIADRRVKISSMAPRQYIGAPSVEDVRKQGQHQMILSAISKKQTFAELINQANAMVTSVLHDPLKRSFNVMPSALRFGVLKSNQAYELVITMKNEDSVAQRLNLKPIGDARIHANQMELGLVAPGMMRKISVTINATEEGTIKEVLHIVTKADIFKIPIEATIMTPENYEREMQEQQAINPSKALTNSRVREKLNQSIQKGRQSAATMSKRAGKNGSVERRTGAEGEEQEGDFDDMEAEDAQNQHQWVETTNSESKLPVLPQAEKRAFDVDPKKNLKDVLKK